MPIRSSALALALLFFLPFVGCKNGATTSTNGGGGPATVSSVTISPANANVQTGQTQQFTANVTVTNSSTSTAVTWTMVGDGTISSSGLFTAGSTGGQATVMATSVAEPSMGSSAAVNVTPSPVDKGKWYGNMTSSNGTQTLPLDFNLTQTGNNLAATQNRVLSMYKAAPPSASCYNFAFNSPALNQFGNVIYPQNMTLSGAINGSNVTLTLQTVKSPSQSSLSAGAETYNLTGAISPEGLTISGTYQDPSPLLAGGCFTGGSGTFSFTQQADLSGKPYTGSVTSGAAGSGGAVIPFTLTFGLNTSTSNAPSSIAMGAVPNCITAQTYYTQENQTSQVGRYFFIAEGSILGQVIISGGTASGIMNDPAGQTLDAFMENWVCSTDGETTLTFQ